MGMYTPSNWYWTVGDHAASGVFSSARGVYVQTSDATYQAWIAAGNLASSIPTEAELVANLAALGVVAQTALGLAAYAANKQQAIAQGGFTVNVNATGAALDVSVSTEPAYAGYLSSAVQLAQMMIAGTAPTANINWVQDSGTVALTPAQVITMGIAVAALVQASFTTLGEVLAAITAGTITTQAQVDTPPGGIPGWPVNS